MRRLRLRIGGIIRKYLPLCIALAVCATLIGGCSTSPNMPAPDTSPVPADKVEVVYFHRAQRCYGCLYAEAGTRYTLETYFKDELGSGNLVFKVVNVEDKENATIVKKYGAFTSSLFVNTITDGTDHIEQVTDIWFVLGNDQAFVEVVKSKIETSLKGTR